MRVGHKTCLDLGRDFPISRAYALRKNVPMLAALLGLSGALGAIYNAGIFPGLNLAGVAQILALLTAAIAARYFYAELYRRTVTYGLDGVRLVISRGIILKKKGSLPLLPVTELYIQRDLMDMIFGLYNLDIFTPVGATKQFARIECLSFEHAEGLQRLLGEVLATQVYLNPAVDDGEEIVVEHTPIRERALQMERRRMLEDQLDRASLPRLPMEKDTIQIQ